MRVSTAAVIALLLMASAGWAASSEKADSSPPPFEQWLPGESYSGGKEYDPRLDQPVRFWGAGIPLKQVFESIREQIGVEIGFWPPGDMNERVCVNLYLNPDKPPSLRELLVQLAWVTDCSFAWERDEGGCRYALLSTSMGDGAIERLLEWVDWVSNERDHAHLAIEREMRDKAIERLSDLREALSVPKDQLVARYKGVDDLLLLATLDPARRAASRFLLTVTEDDLGELQPREGLHRDWRDWTPQQQALLREAMRPCLDQWAQSGMELAGEPGHWDSWGWVESHLADVELWFTDSGGFTGVVLVPTGGGSSTGVDVPFTQLVVDTRAEHSQQAYLGSQIALRRLLGEDINEEEADALQEQRYEVRARARRQQQAQDQLKRQRPLREENEALLASIPLPLEVETPLALWQLQELIARRSGLHIVSDCFWQSERSLKPALERLYPDSHQELTALTALRAAAIPSGSEIGPGVGYLSDGGVSWEWGDTGQFLHFRDFHRDACREMLLPQAALDVLDSWVDVQLPETEAPAQAEVTVPLDPRECGRVFALLSGPQSRYGWNLIYADPTDWHNAYRQAFRERFRRAIEDEHVYRLLARLTDDQWERLSAVGLRWGEDVLPRPSAVETSRHWGNWRSYETGELLRIGDCDPEWPSQYGTTAWKRFVVIRAGSDHPAWEDYLPLNITVKPKSFEHLVASPSAQQLPTR